MKFKALAAATLLMAAGAANATVIVNGNFEGGNTGWTTTGNVNLVNGFPYFGAGNAAQNGLHGLTFNSGDSQPNGTASQTFATVYGQAYFFNFDFGTTSGPSQSLVASVLGADGSTVLGSLTVSDNQQTGLLTRFGFGFFGDGNLATVRFSDVGTNGTVSLDGVIDNVAVTVPEPSSIALMGLAAAALLRSRRRKV